MKLSLKMVALAGAALLSFGGAIGLTNAVAGNTIHHGTDDPAHPLSAEMRQKLNSNGHSFGSALDADTPDEEPELIAVIATNGKTGYVWKTEMDGPEPSNPEDAAKWANPIRTITVYESDGTSMVGTFKVGGGK